MQSTASHLDMCIHTLTSPSDQKQAEVKNHLHSHRVLRSGTQKHTLYFSAELAFDPLPQLQEQQIHAQIKWGFWKSRILYLPSFSHETLSFPFYFQTRLWPKKLVTLGEIKNIHFEYTIQNAVFGLLEKYDRYFFVCCFWKGATDIKAVLHYTLLYFSSNHIALNLLFQVAVFF